MSKRQAEGPHRTKEEGLEMSSIGGEAPKRATAAQLASRTIKSARGRRVRGGAPSSGPTHSTAPFGNIDPNIVPSASSQPQQPFTSNGFAFGQSQSFPPANPTSTQPAQNGTSLSFGGASNPPSFDFSSTFSSGPAPSNPFSNINTPQSEPQGNFQGFQGSLFNLPAQKQNNQSVNDNASVTGFSNTSSAPASNTLFGAKQANTASSAGFLGQSTTQSAAPGGGLFGQQQPFATPSTPASSSQTPATFSGSGSGDAMQTTPDGKSRADAPKAALFGMPAQSNPPFGSNASSTGGDTSIFSNQPPKSNPFTSFGSGPSSEAFPPKPAEPTTSGGSSLFGRVSKPAEQATQAADSNAQNALTPATTEDSGPPRTGGANMFSSAFKPAQAPTTGNNPPKTTGANMFSPSFKPSGSSLSTSPPTKITGGNLFSPSFKPLDQQSASANMFTVKSKSSEEQSPTSARNDISGKTASANISPQFDFSVPPTTTTDFASAKTSGANMFSSISKPSAPASAPAADSAPAKTTTDNVFSPAFKPSAPASTQANAGSSLFANPNAPAAGTNLFSPKPSTGLGTSASATGTSTSLFGKPESATSGTEASAATSSAPLFGTSNALSAAAAPTTTTAPTAAGTLFGAPSTSLESSGKPSSLFSTAPSQSTSGPGNSMFSATAGEANKKGSEDLASTSTTAQQPGSVPKLFSAAPAFGTGTGGNLFAPKAAAQPEAPTTSASATHNMFGQTPKTATTTAPAGEAPKSTSLAETSKTPSTTANSNASGLFDSSKTAPSAASVFGQKSLFSDSSKPAPPGPGSSVKPSSLSASAAPDAGKLFAKPAPSGDAINASEEKNKAPAQSQAAPPAPTQQQSSAPAATSNQGGLQIKDIGERESEVSPYGPPSVPQNVTKDQKADFDKLFRVRALNESFKKKVAEMDPQVGDFVSLVKYYVRVRDAIGSPTGLVRKGGLKRTGEESFDEEVDNSHKRAKPNTESAEIQKSKEVANGHTASIPPTDIEMNGGSGTSGDSGHKTSLAEPPSRMSTDETASTTKRKAEDGGEGRPNGGSPVQAGKRARNTQETQSMTSSLFANSFASSIGAGKKSGSGDSSNKSQNEKQTDEGNNDIINETKTGSSEGRQDGGDATAASTNGRSLFDRIQYNDSGQAKRALVEESSKEEGSKPLPNLFSGSKFASSFNPPGTPSPPVFQNNFDFAKAGAMAASGRNSPINNDKSASQPTDSTKPTTASSGSPAPSTFASNSVLGSQSGPADNTWKNDSPIKFSESKSTESTSTGAMNTVNTTGGAASSSQFPALFGGQSESKGPQSSLGTGNLGDSTQQAGFGFASNTPANPAALKFGLSAVNSADPSRSSTPGVASDTTGAESSGDGEGTENLPQTDLTRTGAGEENEDTLLEMRANAFKLNKGTGWEKQGVGLLRVLKHKTNGRSRALLRADPSGKVVLNVALQGGHPYTSCKNSVQLLVPDSEGKLDQWAVRVKTAESADELANTMKENQTQS